MSHLHPLMPLSLEESLTAHLVQRVSALQGRVFADTLPQFGDRPDSTILPAVVYSEISHRYPQTLSGFTGLGMVTMQISVWAARKTEAVSTRETVRLALDGFRGLMGDDEEGADVQHLMVSDGRAMYDPEAKLYGAMLDFEVAVVETLV